MDAPEPMAGHPLGHPPGQPSQMDTLAWSAGRRERTPKRTASATDRAIVGQEGLLARRPAVPALNFGSSGFTLAFGRSIPSGVILGSGRLMPCWRMHLA